MGSYRYRSLKEGLYTLYRSLIEALYTLNSPPAVSFGEVGVPDEGTFEWLDDYLAKHPSCLAKQAAGFTAFVFRGCRALGLGFMVWGFRV